MNTNTRNLLWFLLFVLLIPIIQCHKRQSPKRDTSKYIAWRRYQSLDRKNFRGQQRPSAENHSAESCLWFDIYKKDLKDSIIIHLTTYFIPDSSWCDPLGVSKRVLDHETRHFDLGEVFTRKFRKYLLEWKGRNKDDFEVYFMIGDFNRQASLLQSQYDSETNHSMNFLAQVIWDNKIDSLLDVYNDYAETELRISINKNRRN